MMNKIPDPSVLSNAEMDLYCKAAYLWASNMMKNAANARATIFNDEGAPVEGEATISSLDNNTERLLNNLIQELARNDKPSTSGTWTKGDSSEPGAYTDAAAQTLPKEEGTYGNIAEAEADGVFLNDADMMWHQKVVENEEEEVEELDLSVVMDGRQRAAAAADMMAATVVMDGRQRARATENMIAATMEGITA
jgi:hypothetical protein